MKKGYESPKAEKMVFEYSNVVVASGKCDETWTWTREKGTNCMKDLVSYGDTKDEATF